MAYGHPLQVTGRVLGPTGRALPVRAGGLWPLTSTGLAGGLWPLTPHVP